MFLDSSKRGRLGFTLVEVLIATTLVLALLVCAGSGLFQGVRLYEKLIFISQDEKLDLFFERLTKDLKNSTNYTKAGFMTSGTGVSFCVLKNRNEAEEKYLAADPVKVTYEFDAKLGQIKRSEQDLIGGGLKQEVLLTDLRAFSLSVLGDETESYPKGVDVELTLASGSYQKKISIPLSYAPVR